MSVPLPMRLSRSESGHTLVEVMVATGIFVIGMTGVFTLQTMAAQGNGMATDISVASNLASSALERLRMDDYDDVAGASVCPPPAAKDLDCYFNKHGQAFNTPSYFTRTWVVVVDPVNDVKDITVTVTWTFNFLGASTTLGNRRLAMTGRIYPRLMP